MKHKDVLAVDKILECAKQEFLEKGFAEASIRTIADKAGYSTGMLYGRFADKNALFRALVQEGADKLYRYFFNVQEEFASFPIERQKSEMHSYVDRKVDVMVDIIYDHFDAFKLIVCKSAGSSYEHYIDQMIEVETDSTVRFIEALRATGVEIRDIRADLNHMLASALFYGMFEVVAHEFPKEDAFVYIKQIQEFFNAGWDKLLSLN